MRRTFPARRHRPDLIARPPLAGVGVEHQWASLIIDPVDQMRALVDLRDRGLISSAELAAQRRLIFVTEPEQPDPGTSR